MGRFFYKIYNYRLLSQNKGDIMEKINQEVENEHTNIFYKTIWWNSSINLKVYLLEY